MHSSSSSSSSSPSSFPRSLAFPLCVAPPPLSALGQAATVSAAMQTASAAAAIKRMRSFDLFPRGAFKGSPPPPLAFAQQHADKQTMAEQRGQGQQQCGLAERAADAVTAQCANERARSHTPSVVPPEFPVPPPSTDPLAHAFNKHKETQEHDKTVRQSVIEESHAHHDEAADSSLAAPLDPVYFASSVAASLRASPMPHMEMWSEEHRIREEMSESEGEYECVRGDGRLVNYFNTMCESDYEGDGDEEEFAIERGQVTHRQQQQEEENKKESLPHGIHHSSPAYDVFYPGYVGSCDLDLVLSFSPFAADAASQFIKITQEEQEQEQGDEEWDDGQESNSDSDEFELV